MNRKKVLRILRHRENINDKVNRDQMCALLERIGMSEKVVKIIKSMYENARYLLYG